MPQSTTTINLEDILQAAPASLAPESILLTGVILRNESADRFTLQHQASSRSVYSVFCKADVIGPVMTVPESRLPLSELGQAIHAVRLKKGATGILFNEAPHRIGDHPHAPNFLEEYAYTGSSLPQFAALDTILAAAPHRPGPPYGVFPGVIHPGPEPDEILLQVSPPNKLDYAIIKRADILDPDSICALPPDSLPLTKRGFQICLVRVREGATIRAVTGMQARVEIQPSSNCGCGGGCGGNGKPELPVEGDEMPVLARGRRCSTKPCRNDKGELTTCCAVEGSVCDYQWATGVCTTSTSWWRNWILGTHCYCWSIWAPI